MQRGERQNERTEEALIVAFMQLVKEKSYDSITIQEISDQANVGRSTFYRHFASKADVLLKFHETIFAQLTLVYASADQWLANEAPSQLVYFLQQMQSTTSSPGFSLFRFGNDIDYIFGKMDELLTNAFAQSLAQAFAGQTSTIPLSLLAQSIAGVYGSVMRSWITGHSVLTAQEVATHLQRLVRSAICAAL